MFELLLGFLLGLVICGFVVYALVFDPWSEPVPPPSPIDQFPLVQIPEELSSFLRTGTDGQGLSAWESSFSLSLLFHFLFQEHKDSRVVRRWFHKRVQLELNDLTTRYATGRLIQDIRIRELSLGMKFPIIKSMRVEKVEMSADKNNFESITFLINMDYNGGFEASIDVTSFLGKAILSMKVTKLRGLLRVILSRKPFNHWAFSFITTPEFDFDVSSQVGGHQLRHVIPLLTQAFRKILQRKHVWPNYKIRYRPVFPNPLLQPSPPLSAFSHIHLVGGLEVTVLQCTRLNIASLNVEKYYVYCTASLEQRPFVHSSSSQNAHAISVLLCFPRRDRDAPIGLSFHKDVSGRLVRVANVERNTLADEARFKSGDVLLAINNVPIRTERQVIRLLGSTIGDLMVLVERRLEDADQNGFFGEETADGEFTCLGGSKEDTLTDVNRKSRSPSSDSMRRHSISNFPTDVTPETPSGSVASSSLFREEQSPAPRPFPSVNRTESARVPSVLVSMPSVDLRRTRSESQLLSSFDSSTLYEVDVEPEIRMEHSGLLGRANFESSSLQEIERVGDPEVREKEKTLLSAQSTASIATSSSAQTLGSTRTDGDDELEGRLSRSRPPSTRRQRLHAKLVIGKQKLASWTSKRGMMTKESATDDDVDAAIDALDPDAMRSSPSPSPSMNKLAESSGEKQKKKAKKKKGVDPKASHTLSTSRSTSVVHSRSTKSVRLSSEHVMWGQSLHFELEGDATARRYLNVTVHAKRNGEDSAPPTLLGYIIDDCQLTLSNCHREVFHLRPPNGFGSILDAPTAPSELARHNGFDPRLCFGDVALGFRYFPNGLPEGAGESPNDASDEEETEEQQKLEQTLVEGSPVKTSNSHEWKSIQCKNPSATCVHCKGKIWLKWAACCQRCSLVSHRKCTSKMAPCSPSSSCNDNAFEELSLAGTEREEGRDYESTIRSLPPDQNQTPNVYAAEKQEGSRRTRLRDKVAQKFSSWRGRGQGSDKSADSKLSEEDRMSLTSLSDVLPQLEGSPHLMDVFYMPGNAYNEDTINNARRLGKFIFQELPIEERKVKINEQIDKIQRAINETSVDRLEALREKEGRETKRRDDGAREVTKFERLEERLQALAVLMLHYCAALQNCSDLEEEVEEPAPSVVDDKSPSVSHSMDSNQQTLDLVN